MTFKTIEPGDMLRTAGHVSLVTGVRRTARGVVVDLAADPHSRPASVPVELLRLMSDSGVEVRVISGSRPPRERRRHGRDVRRFSRVAPTTSQA